MVGKGACPRTVESHSRQRGQAPFPTLRLHKSLFAIMSRLLHLIRANPRLANFLQHFANLFCVSLLVVTEKRNGCHSVQFSQKWMFEDYVFQSLLAVGCAKRFQTLPDAIEVCHRRLFQRRVAGIHRLRSFNANQPNGNDGGGNETSQEADSTRRTPNRLFEFFYDACFHQAKMVNNLSNAPFTRCGPARIDVWFQRTDGAVQFFVNRIQPGERSLH